MFEDKTYEKILTEDLASVPGDVNRREGSFVFAALSALALEVEKLYLGMDYTIEMAYASTADHEHLVLLCGDRGIIPYEASRGRAEGVFNLEVPIGARFSIAGLIYRVVEVYEDPEYEHAYVMECETAGSGANGVLGKLTAVTFISGLEQAELVKVLVAGRDAETKEELYERYRLSFSEESYGGNVQEYREKVNGRDGVGGCKVYPVWNGPGTVKVVVIGSDLTAPSDYLVQELQELLCPEPALGYGLAPIDHDVMVEAVEETGIRVASDITFQKNYSLEVCQKGLDDAVRAYLASIAAEWADGTEEDTGTVYLAKVQSVLLDAAGVQDVANTTLNGVKANVVLASSQIPVLEGSVNG